MDEILTNSSSQMGLETTQDQNSLNIKQKIMLVSITINNCFHSMVFSLIGSFFPPQAYNKGLTATEVGIIFSAFPLTSLIFAYLCGFVVILIGSRRMMILSSFIGATINIPFAFVLYSDPGIAFFVFCVTCRIFQGIGYVCMQTASMQIMTTEFKAQTSTVSGMITMAYGVGGAIGPIFGGTLYDNLGFQAPFLGFSVLLYCGSLLSFFTVFPKASFLEEADYSGDKNEAGSTSVVAKLCQMPEIAFPLLAELVSPLGQGYQEMSISEHVASEFGGTPTLSGILMMSTGVIATFLSPFVGYYSDKKTPWDYRDCQVKKLY